LVRHGERAFDHAISDVVQIDLEHGETLLQLLALHPSGGGTALRAPQGLHVVEVVRLDGGHELRQGFRQRLRRGRLRPASAPAREGAQRDEQQQSWPHERVLEWVGVTRRYDGMRLYVNTDHVATLREARRT